MSESKFQTAPETSEDESRVMPLLIAGLGCFVIAALLGYGTWSVFGSQARENGVTARFLQRIGLSDPAGSNASASTNTETAESARKPPATNPDADNINASESATTPVIAGLLAVEGGEFAVGGGETQRPLQRVFVENFRIAETEVTNAQYAEFISETGHRAPIEWNGAEFPKGTGEYPVVNVSWHDANAFCVWLGNKYQQNVRLPTQAEWELAAGGAQRFKYPWGNDWNDDGVEPEKSDGASPVKSFPVNKSPFGAYDMLGNVWEWTSEEISRKEMESEVAKRATTENEKIYLALGGSFNEDRSKLGNTFWAELKANTRTKSLGFRYVIIGGEPFNN
jgi:formylglycine-generating enzyme required for sulfatase activity